MKRESYLVSGGLRRSFDIWLKEFVVLVIDDVICVWCLLPSDY